MSNIEQSNEASSTIKVAGEIAGNEFLAFTLGKEEYGIDILKVQEIRGYEAVTRSPRSLVRLRNGVPALD